MVGRHDPSGLPASPDSKTQPDQYLWVAGQSLEQPLPPPSLGQPPGLAAQIGQVDRV